MLLKLAQLSSKDDFILQAFLRLLKSGCQLHQVELVSHYLVAMETWMEEGAWTKLKKTSGGVWCLMAKAAALVFTGKVGHLNLKFNQFIK